jgi:hypothetical protein
MKILFSLRDFSKYIAFAISIVVILRPLTFTEVGDFLIYLKGSRELVSGIDLYNIDRAPFGSRYFNGPILAFLLLPFTCLDSGLALFLFRVLNIAAILVVFQKYSGLRLVKSPEIYLLLLLLFPIRMNTNLAQGSGIALLLYVWTLHLLFNRKLKWSASKNQALASIAFVLASNYKPQLGFLMFLFAILMRKNLFILLVLAQILSFEIIAQIFDWQFSYLDWFKLLIERTERIQTGSSESIFGPFSLLGRMLTFNPTVLMAIMVILLVSFFAFVAMKCRLANRQEFDIQFSQLTLALAPLTVSYSPLQDSIAVVVLFLVASKTKISKKLTSVETMILLILLLPTDLSILNFLSLVTVGIVLVHPRRIDFRVLLPLLSLIIFLLEKNWYSHMIYDLVGFAVLILTLKITVENVKSLTHPNREEDLKERL